MKKWGFLILATIAFLFATLCTILGFIVIGVGISGSNASGEGAILFFNLAKLAGGVFVCSLVLGIYRLFRKIPESTQN